MSEKSGGRKSDRFDSWRHMSGEGRRVLPSPHEQHGGQYHSKISFAPTSDASAGGFKIGGLIKRVRRPLHHCSCLTISPDNYRENARF
jgi:hypothetical protein